MEDKYVKKGIKIFLEYAAKLRIHFCMENWLYMLLLPFSNIFQYFDKQLLGALLSLSAKTIFYRCS